MGMDIVDEKKRLRKEMRQQRDVLDQDVKANWDDSICTQLSAIIEERNLRVVHTYLTMGSEINVLPLVQKLLDLGIQVVCPKTLPNRQLENRILKSLDQLEEGVMKTFYPRDPEIFDGEYDLIIVPGLAFDSQNYRLGYGGGYYDGFLAQQKNAFTVGLFYAFQEVDNVPRESHDLSFDLIVTPK